MYFSPEVQFSKYNFTVPEIILPENTHRGSNSELLGMEFKFDNELNSNLLQYKKNSNLHNVLMVSYEFCSVS